MADFNTIRASAAGARAAQIDEGLRAHMNKVYGTMSVGTLLTFLGPGLWGPTPPCWVCSVTR
jgi:FtsH-binding integral membrane protein